MDEYFSNLLFKSDIFLKKLTQTQEYISITYEITQQFELQKLFARLLDTTKRN